MLDGTMRNKVAGIKSLLERHPDVMVSPHDDRPIISTDRSPQSFPLVITSRLPGRKNRRIIVSVGQGTTLGRADQMLKQGVPGDWYCTTRCERHAHTVPTIQSFHFHEIGANLEQLVRNCAAFLHAAIDAWNQVEARTSTETPASSNADTRITA